MNLMSMRVDAAEPWGERVVINVQELGRAGLSVRWIEGRTRVRNGI